MDIESRQIEVSVIVPARNEEAVLGKCLESLVRQSSSHPLPEEGRGWGTRQPRFEVIVVDDHSTDGTRDMAARFAVRAIEAPALPEGWSGKCNACWTGAKAARGKWLLFTDADTVHRSNSIAAGLREAKECGAAFLSYSPKQEVRGFAARALMPVIFAELANTYKPKDVSDPSSPAAAANGQYLLIRRDAYDAVGGHAAVATAILEDVELARGVKQAGYRLRFRMSDIVRTRMYRTFPQMWEGWTKNLALLFPRPVWLAGVRLLEFALIVLCAVGVGLAVVDRDLVGAGVNGVLLAFWLTLFVRRIRRAHFDGLSNTLSIFGVPLFAILLVNSVISHERGKVKWKGRVYDTTPPYRPKEGR